MFSVLLVACSTARTSSRGTHTSIVENISRVGEDGSYSYGWTASDGTFRKETRKKTGEVSGEFGYRDSQGDLVTTKYGVNRDTQFGFKGQKY